MIAGQRALGRGRRLELGRRHALSPRIGPAVDEHGRAGDVASTRRGEERDRRRDLLGQAGPAHRHLRGVRGNDLGAPVLLQPFRLDQSCRDADGPEPEARPLVRQRSRHRLERRAGHRRVRHHRDAAPRAEPEEEDRSDAPRDHPPRRHLVGEVPHGVDVQAVHGSQPLERDVLRRRGELASRVVHQHVDVPESLVDLVEEPGHLLGLAHVARPDEHLVPAVGELRGGSLDGLGSSAADRDTGAGARELERRRSADARAASRHDRDLPCVRVGGERRSEGVYHAAQYARGARHDGHRRCRRAAHCPRLRPVSARHSRSAPAPRPRVVAAHLGSDAASTRPVGSGS